MSCVISTRQDVKFPWDMTFSQDVTFLQDVTLNLQAWEIVLFTWLRGSVKLFSIMYVWWCVIKISNHGSYGAAN